MRDLSISNDIDEELDAYIRSSGLTPLSRTGIRGLTSKDQFKTCLDDPEMPTVSEDDAWHAAMVLPPDLAAGDWDWETCVGAETTFYIDDYGRAWTTFPDPEDPSSVVLAPVFAVED